MQYFDFANPWALMFMLILAPLWYWHKRSIADMPNFRRKAVFIIRILLVIAIVFSLADFRIKLPAKKLSVVFCVDSSLSISPDEAEWIKAYIKKQLEKKAPEDEAGIILFGKDAYLEEALSKDIKVSRFSTIITPLYTDIGRAIQTASAVFPDATIKRIVIISDGKQNIGDADKEASIASARGIEIDCAAPPASGFNEVMLGSVEAPPITEKGSPFALKIEVDSDSRKNAKINIYRNNNLVGREDIQLGSGKNIYTLSQRVDKSGVYKYKVSVEATGDTYPQNNVYETVVSVAGKPKALYLASDERQYNLIASILKEHKIDVEPGDKRSVPEDLSAFSGYRAIILDNFGAFNLSAAQLQAIENYVKDFGGGLMMIGGDKSFGAGGYYRTPVERVLPVSLDVKKKITDPSIAMILCIDKSGSMAESTGKHEKVTLAREAAIATVDMMNPFDIIGVIAFDDEAKWVVRPTAAENKKRIISEIATIRAGGGTFIYPAMDGAYEALKNTDAMIKHIIILTDGRSAPGDYNTLVKKLKEDKMTLSTVAVGEDADVPFLKELAKEGDGRFYYTDEANYLPRILVQESIIAGRAAIIEEPFYPKQARPAEFLTGVDQNSFPKLYGYAVTTPKERAELSLVTGRQDPLLAYWRAGLGKSIAFTSDDGLRWGKDWLAWKDYEKFWTQAVRWIMPDISSGNYSIAADISAGNGQISVETYDPEGNPVDFKSLVARISSPSGASEEVSLDQAAQGSYNASFKAQEVGTYFVTVFDETTGAPVRAAQGAFSVPYSPEYKDLDNDLRLLENISSKTGGRMLKDSDSVFIKSGKPAFYSRSAWQELLIFVLLLLPFDVALRRVYLSENFLANLKNRITKLKEEGMTITKIEYVDPKLLALREKKREIREQHSSGIPDGLIAENLKEDKSGIGTFSQLRALKEVKKAELAGFTSVSEIKPEKAQAKSDAVAEKNEGTLSRLKKVKKDISNPS